VESVHGFERILSRACLLPGKRYRGDELYVSFTNALHGVRSGNTLAHAAHVVLIVGRSGETGSGSNSRSGAPIQTGKVYSERHFEPQLLWLSAASAYYRSYG